MTSPRATPRGEGVVRPGRPRGPRRDRDERRAELLDAAERAVRRIGPQASMDELAAEAGVTKPILYSHFGDKAGLVTALAERVAGRLNAAVIGELAMPREPAQAPREVVAATIAAFCTFIESEPALYRFLVQTAIHQPRGSGTRVAGDISKEIAVSLGSGLRRAGADSGAAELWATAIVGMTIAGAGWWLERRSMSKDDMVEYLTQLLWSGLSGAGLHRAIAEPGAGDGDGAAAGAGVAEAASVTPLRGRGPGRGRAAGR
jgi:AcrR family transcriptional regulator